MKIDETQKYQHILEKSSDSQSSETNSGIQYFLNNFLDTNLKLSIETLKRQSNGIVCEDRD